MKLSFSVEAIEVKDRFTAAVALGFACLSLAACGPTIVDKDYSHSTGAMMVTDAVPLVNGGDRVGTRHGTVVCVYAATDIPADTVFTREQLEERDSFEEKVPGDAVTVKASIVGRKAVHKILAGTRILKRDVESAKTAGRK